MLEEVTAGRLAHGQVRPGTAVRIMTGGTLPPGADAVVMVEEVEETDGRALLQHQPRPGENVHPPGMDLARGQHVLAAGTALGAAEIGLLATVGCSAGARVFAGRAWRCWRPAMSSSSRTRRRRPGSVRDSNRYALMAAAEEAGAEVVWHGHRPSTTKRCCEQAMRDGLGDADVLMTSGGVSMGTRDLIKPLLERWRRSTSGGCRSSPASR